MRIRANSIRDAILMASIVLYKEPKTIECRLIGDQIVPTMMLTPSVPAAWLEEARARKEGRWSDGV